MTAPIRFGIVGGEGFIGSAFVRALEKQGLKRDQDFAIITHAHYREAAAREYDILIDANGNSSKVLAERDPSEDHRRSVASVEERLRLFRFRKYIYLSSCDVYSDCSSPTTTREDSPEKLTRGANRYGAHKRQAELAIERSATDWLIFRVGGVVGPGLKKNPIFDLQQGHPLFLSLESRLQYLTTDDVARIVLELTHRSREHINLCGRGTVRLKDIHELTGRRSPVALDLPTVTYDINIDRLSNLTRVPSSEDAVKRHLTQDFSDVSILISAFNEESCIVACLEKLIRVLPGAEILVIHGGTDRTAARAEEFARAHPGARIVVIPHHPDEGKGHAIQTGIARARGTRMAQFDADLQFAAEDLPALLAPLSLPGPAGADIVIGSRFLPDSNRQGYRPLFIRDLGNRIVNRVLTWLAGQPITDVTTGMKSWTRAAITAAPFRDRRFVYEMEIPLRGAMRGLRIAQIPVSYFTRQGGISGHGAGLREFVSLALTGFKILFHAILIRLRIR